jgi:ClpP class serine protease
MKKRFALNYLMQQMWAVDQSLLTVMADIASRNGDIDLDEFKLLNPQALEGKSGRTLTPRMELREGGIALIHVTGVISRYASLFDDICGGISTEALAKDFNAALDDPAIRGIVMNFDGPGGDANGIHEMAEMVYNARGVKPITGYVGGQCASALYWIASACDSVVIDATARLGSIGVVMCLERTKPAADAADQTERLEVVSSQSPNKRLDPFSKEGQAACQAQVDQLADIFIDRVARNMAVDRDTVINDFGRGGVLIGQSAVDIGMANRLGSLESVIDELKGGKTTMTQSKTGATGGNQTIALALPAVGALNAADVVAAITAQRPDVLTAIKGEPLPSALSAAESIAKQCADAGMPELAASLLKDGMTQAAAEKQITTAKALKDTLSAAGLSGSFSALSAHLSDPVKLVGQAIHEAKASMDESSDQSRQIVEGQGEKTQLSASDIYKNRRKGTAK